jgi:hypothetical protein
MQEYLHVFQAVSNFDPSGTIVKLATTMVAEEKNIDQTSASTQAIFDHIRTMKEAFFFVVLLFLSIDISPLLVLIDLSRLYKEKSLRPLGRLITRSCPQHIISCHPISLVCIPHHEEILSQRPLHGDKGNVRKKLRPEQQIDCR